MAESVLEHIQQLSSGTIATISGFNSYENIDRLRNDFFDWSKSAVAAGKRFSSWQEAWHSYVKSQVVRTIPISGLNRDKLSLKEINALTHFESRRLVNDFIDLIGWRKKDAMRVHNAFYGYRWIICDDHMNAVKSQFLGEI